MKMFRKTYQANFMLPKEVLVVKVWWQFKFSWEECKTYFSCWTKRLIDVEISKLYLFDKIFKNNYHTIFFILTRPLHVFSTEQKK